MKRKTYRVLLAGALVVLVIECLVLSSFVYQSTPSQVSYVANDVLEEGDMAGYAPAFCIGTLVAIDKENILLYVDLPISSQGDRAATKTVCFSCSNTTESYWYWFIDNAKPGNSVGISYHLPSQQIAANQSIDAISIKLWPSSQAE